MAWLGLASAIHATPMLRLSALQISIRCHLRCSTSLQVENMFCHKMQSNETGWPQAAGDKRRHILSLSLSIWTKLLQSDILWPISEFGLISPLVLLFQRIRTSHPPSLWMHSIAFDSPKTEIISNIVERQSVQTQLKIRERLCNYSREPNAKCRVPRESYRNYIENNLTFDNYLNFIILV